MSAGRPTKRTPERVESILAGLRLGDPLTEICAGLDLCDDTVRDWAKADEEFSRAIARAREAGEDAIAHRLRRTARGRGADAGGDSTGDVQRDRLIVETDLKLLAKFNPKRWGDKVQHADADGNRLPAPQWIVQPVMPGPLRNTDPE